MSGLSLRELPTLLGVESLERPLLLALLAALGMLLWLATRRRPPAAIPWPALAEARAAGARRYDPVHALARLLRIGALACLALVLAGPVSLHRAPAEAGAGLDVVLVLDASGSMRALDAQVGGEWRSRFDLAREVVTRFATARAAAGDRVGLVVFGDSAYTQCPLTGDGRLLAASLERVEPGIAGESTALGDALALALRRVSAASGGRRHDPADPEAGLAARGAADPGAMLPALRVPGEPLAGRLVVLLTDGRSNTGAVPVDVAAALARRAGVRVHAVGIGSEGEVSMAGDPGAGGGLRFERHDLDAATLARIAAASGGRFFRARASRDLAAVYQEIDALERVPRSEPPRERRAARPEPLLALAGGLLLFELAAARLLWRRLP